jgi:acetolactate decarboxylase
MRLIHPSSILVAMTLLSCTGQGRIPPLAIGSGGSIPSEGRAAGDIQVWGSLRSLMHEGKTEARVALKDVAPGPHAYAVGAVSGLRGEVTILDDDIIVSLGEAGGTVRTPAQGADGETATLLVRALVPRWSSHNVEGPLGGEHVDAQLEAIATATGLDVEKKRIPVLVEGTAKDLKWHVLGGKAEAGHNAHDGPRSIGTLSRVKVTLVGFLSRNDEGVFTHMGQHTHFHVVTMQERMTAHVDGFELEPGAIVRLPAR